MSLLGLVYPSGRPIASHSWMTVGREGLGALVDAATLALTSGWPTANLALYVPMWLEESVTVTRMFWYNGTAATNGNADMGIFNSSGTKIASTGATATSGTSVLQFVNTTDIRLSPGRYWLGLSLASTSDRIARVSSGLMVAEALRAFGCKQEASAHPLPASITGAAYAQTFIPWMGCEIATLT